MKGKGKGKGKRKGKGKGGQIANFLFLSCSLIYMCILCLIFGAILGLVNQFSSFFSFAFFFSID